MNKNWIYSFNYFQELIYTIIFLWKPQILQHSMFARLRDKSKEKLEQIFFNI